MSRLFKLSLTISVSTVDGGWSVWQGWSVCSVTCADGVKTRQRLCNNPAPAHSGLPCPGTGSEQTSCNEGKCPGCKHAVVFLLY